VYEWGGYLGWKLSEKKVFVDGRMTTWRQDALENESSSAYKDSKRLLTGELKLREIVKKYNISTIIYYSKADLDDSFYRQMVTLPGWKEVYSDNLTVVYQTTNKKP
jgi:hypothetical protein